MSKMGILICAILAIALGGYALGQPAPAENLASTAEQPAVAAPAAPAGPSASEIEMKQKLEKTGTALDAAMRRIDELEAKVNNINTQMGATTQDVNSLSTQMKDLEGKAKAPAAGGPAPAVKITPYGYVKFDVARDNNQTNSTDNPNWVLSPAAHFSNDHQFTMTLRQTRFGINLEGPDVEGAKSTGKIEIDFYGTAAAENKAMPMMRQAYWQLSYPTWNVLVGQTWEPLAPLFPNTLNYNALALQGNMGYRKPQIRYERMDKVFGDKTIQTDVAVVRSIGNNVVSTSSLDDEGSDAGWPVLQSRVAFSTPTSIGRPLAIGLSGHYGTEEFNTVTVTAGPPAAFRTVNGKGRQFETVSGNLDWTVPVWRDIDVIGEFWIGKNVDAFTGGIGQGVNCMVNQGTRTATASLEKGVEAIGGWTQVTYRPKPLPKWLFNAGIGIDDPENDDLSGSLNRTRNSVEYANAIYSLNANTKIGVEVSWMATDFIAAPEGENLRIQGALQYNF